MIDEKIKAQAREMMGVPKSVINEKTFIEGALPESAYVKQVMNALK